MKPKVTFYGVPRPAPIPFPSGEVLPFPKSVSRKAALRIGGRAIGKALTRAIPFAGAALTAWELYDYLQNYADSPALLNTGGWVKTLDCGLPEIYQFPTSGGACGDINTMLGVVPFGTYQYPYRFKETYSFPFLFAGTLYVPTAGKWERPIGLENAYSGIAPNPYLPRPNGLPWPLPGPQWNPNIGPMPSPHPDALPSAFQAPRPETGPRVRSRPRTRPRTLPSPHWEFETPPSGPQPPRPRLRPRVAPRPDPAPDEEPYPDPLPSPKLEPFVPLPSRPKEGTKERKFRGTYTAFQLLNALSEVAEAVDCLYNTLPSTKIRNEYNRAYAEEMKDFWKQYNANVKSGLIRTARDKAIFLDAKPKYNKKMTSPLKAAKKARKGNYANNTKNLGINEADVKAQYIYDNFHELNAGVMGEALQCTIIDQYVDKVIARGVPRRLVTKARERARDAQRNIRKGRL